ncbi:retinoic acid-induced protein 2 [Pelodytes ibericus]
MEELYKEAPDLHMDLNSSPSAIPNNKIENGVAQLITAEAWNINPSGLMKKALSPLVTVPASPVLSPNSESQSGVALKMAATVLQPICLGESPVVLPIHWQVAGGTPPQMSTNSSTPYVITTQGPVPLPVLLEQHVFQHLNSPLVLPQGPQCPATTIQNHLFPGTTNSVGQPQILDQKTSNPAQEPVLPTVFQTPGFPAVLQDFFPSPNSLGAPSPCHVTPDYSSNNNYSIPQQAFSSPLSPLVPPATLLVPYPVIVPLPVPVPIPIPIPIPMSQAESKGNSDHAKPTGETQKSCKETQTPLEKEEVKPFEFTAKSEFSQFNRHSVIKMGNENEALDLSLKNEPLVKDSINNQVLQEDGVLDLSVPVYKKCGNTSGHINMSISCGSLTEPLSHSTNKTCSTAGSYNPPLIHHELMQKQDSRIICTNSAELLRQQKWAAEQSSRIGFEPKVGNNIELVSSSQTAKVIVSVKDAVPAIFCGKIKGLSGVSTKNFSIKRDLPQNSAGQCYDMKGQAEIREGVDALRKPLKNKSVKLKKVNSQEIHILPIKKQRLAAFFPRK